MIMKSTLCIFQRKQFLIVFTVILLMMGCTRTEPVSYYQLSAFDNGHASIAGNAIGDSIIGIGPIRLPEYLDRQKILIRLGDNQLQLLDNHRWIEPLTDNISSVLREDLAILFNTERLLLYPWDRNTSVSYQLIINLVHFEAIGYQKAHLEAIWSILDVNGNILLSEKRSNYNVAIASPDEKGIASALSETLELLCRQIVQELSQKLGGENN